MSHDIQRQYEHLCQHVRQIALFSSIDALLGWDERTLLPPEGAEYRTEQMALLSGMIHDRWTDRQLGEWLDRLAASPLAADPHSDSGATIRRVKRRRDRKVKLSKKLVEELTRATVLGQQAWEKARRQNDFAVLRPCLEKIVQLKRQEAEALGYPQQPYDALLDDFEPDALTSQVAQVLNALREQLVPLVEAVRQSKRRPDLSILARTYPRAVQEEFGRDAAARIGFDFSRGRLDVTTHPFCSTMGPRDCRITTRYDERHFSEAFFGILHEAGHGIYEQGLRAEQFGLPLGEAVSSGIHESQSRLWENLVGRSLAFWEYFYPEAQRRFPQALGEVPLRDFHFAINDVRPSLVRIEADEATYNLHIFIRFELERALFSGDLTVADLPGAWKEKYRQTLGITPPDDLQGVLQDIHWSAGLFGYFPTYALGNLYAAQFFAQAEADLGGLDARHTRGEFQPLRQWLNEKIHRQGQRYSAAELVERVTGRPLSHVPLIEHLRKRLAPLYGLRD